MVSGTGDDLSCQVVDHDHHHLVLAALTVCIAFVLQAMTPGPWLAVPDHVLRLHAAEGRVVSAPDLQNLERALVNKQLTSLAWHLAQPILALGSNKGKCCQTV